MKLKGLRLAALIIASIINIWLALILFIIGAHLVQELNDGDHDPLFEFIDIPMSLFILLSLVAVIVAWFKSRIGGILITIAAIGLIFSDLNDLHLGRFPQYILLVAGLLLLFYVYYDQRLFKGNID